MITTSFKDFCKNDLGNFILLSKKEYSNQETTSSKHICWKHCSSPFGKSTYVNIKYKNKIIGRTLLQPKKFRIGLKNYKVALVTDLLIDPKYRFPPTNFIKLTKACENTGSFDFIYHTSNNITEKFYKKLFKFPQPINMSGYGFPIKISNFINKKIGIKFKPLDLMLFIPLKINYLLLKAISIKTEVNIVKKVPSNREIKNLISQGVANQCPFFFKNQDILRWRLEKAPLWQATVYSINKGKKNYGYFSARIVNIGTIKFYTIIDFIYSDKLTKLELFKIKLMQFKMAKKSGSDALFTMLNGKSELGAHAIGYPFLKIPDFMLPHNTPIFVRPIPKSIPSNVISGTHITLADLDYF